MVSTHRHGSHYSYCLHKPCAITNTDNIHKQQQNSIHRQIYSINIIQDIFHWNLSSPNESKLSVNRYIYNNCSNIRSDTLVINQKFIWVICWLPNFHDIKIIWHKEWQFIKILLHTMNICYNGGRSYVGI